MLGGRHKNRLGTSAHKQCINKAVKEVYGISATVDSVPHAGSTDKEIVRRMCESCGLQDTEVWTGLDRVIEISCALIHELIEDDLTGLVLPGVGELLHALTERRAFVGMVTGNFSTIGWAKIEKAGLGQYLSESLNQPSAFGSDCLHRNEILALAVERAEAQGFVRDVDPETLVTNNVWHIGDAIADMAAARHVKGRGIGVLTGSFTAEILAPEKPFAILQNLADTDALLAMMGISSSNKK